MRKEYVLLMFVAVVAGSSHPITKLILREMTPLQLALLRGITGFAILAAIALATGRLSTLRRLTLTSFALAVVAGLFGFAGMNILSNMALRSIPAAVNGLLLNTSPVWIALFSPLLLHERLTRRIVLGTFVALFGIVIVTIADVGLDKWQSLSWVGVFFSLGAGLAWALYTVCGRPLMRTFDTIGISALMSFIGALILAGVVLPGDGVERVFAASLSAKLLGVYLGVVVTALSAAIWYFCLKTLPAAQVGVFQYPVPVFAVILSALILGEPITLPLVLGMIFILMGVYLVQQRPGQPILPKRLQALLRDLRSLRLRPT